MDENTEPRRNTSWKPKPTVKDVRYNSIEEDIEMLSTVHLIAYKYAKMRLGRKRCFSDVLIFDRITQLADQSIHRQLRRCTVTEAGEYMVYSVQQPT